MTAKSDYLQIRVTPAEKAKLKRLARAAGVDLSTYVMTRSLPPAHVRFTELVRALAEPGEERYVLAELNDFLSSAAIFELSEAVEVVDLGRLSPFLANYLAAMVEQASHNTGTTPPSWTRRVHPLDRPHFAVPMKALRLHLLKAAPVPFKRRNIFVDASLGARV